MRERPSLPEGTKVLTIPAVELKKMEETEGDSALNQQVVKKSKKKWVLNPTGKSMESFKFIVYSRRTYIPIFSIIPPWEVMVENHMPGQDFSSILDERSGLLIE